MKDELDYDPDREAKKGLFARLEVLEIQAEENERQLEEIAKKLEYALDALVIIAEELTKDSNGGSAQDVDEVPETDPA